MINRRWKSVKYHLGFGLMLILFSVVLIFAFKSSQSFSDSFNYTFSAGLRYVLSLVTGWFSFSLFEVLLISTIPICAAVIIAVIRRRLGLTFVISEAVFLIGILLLIFVTSFGVCYFCSPLEEKMSLDRQPVDRKELYDCSEVVKHSLYNTLDDVNFSSDGSSENPYSWQVTDRLIDRGFDRLRSCYDFISSSDSVAKHIMLSKPMTHTHISGIYMPLTGEANVNTNYPDYVVAFSVAHEKAHQRGIAGEDEANFVGFLALINSGDSYLEYSAYMTMYDYFLESMYKYDSQMYHYLISSADARVLNEMYAYSKFFDEYRNSRASKVSDSVNDTYIKAMGDDKGVKSYGLVVELMCAYIKDKALH